MRKAENLDKNLVWSEYFNDEQSVRRNGGVPTDVTFDNGIGIFNGSTSRIKYPTVSRGVGTVRFKFKPGTFVGNQIVVDFRGESYTGGVTRLGYVYFNSSGLLLPSTGTIYINGVLNNQLVVDEDQEVIISGITLKPSQPLDVGMNYAGSAGSELNGDLSLLEIYNKALTVEEVTNLYNDARYRVPNLEHEAQGDGTDLNVSVCENAPSLSLTTFSSLNSSSFSAISDGSSNQLCGTADESTIVSGQRYVVEFNMALNSGIAPSVNLKADLEGSGISEEGAQECVNGYNIFTFTASSGTTACLGFRFNSIASDIDVTNLSFQPLTVEPTSKILHVTAKNGVVQNLLAGGGVNIQDEGVGNFNIDIEGWFGYAANTVTHENNSIKISYIDNQYGAAVQLNEVSDIRKDLIVGASYILRFAAKNNGVGTNQMRVYNNAENLTSEFLTTEFENYVIEFIAQGTTQCVFSPIAMDSGGAIWIDWWSIEEFIPEPVVTNVEIIKESPWHVPRFKALTSKIDLGDYNDLTGDISILMWVRPSSFGTGTSNGHLLCNKPLIANAGLLIRWSSSQIQMTSNSDSGTAVGTSHTWKFNEYVLVILLRTATGLVTAYVNGEQNGADNNDSGTPEAGETNIIIGNNTGQIRPYAGDIPETIIISGLLTPAEISQYYTATKHKYNK